MLGISVGFLPSARAAQDAADDRAHREAVTRWVADHRKAILDELKGFLALPNDAHHPEDMRANAAHLRAMFEKRGLETRLLEVNGAPYIFARLQPEGKPAADPAPVVLFYCHFDGQAVDPARWTVGKPFAPTLRGDPADPNARIYARSASDDKSPIVGLLAAIDALRATGVPPNIDAKFIFDPEEEIGSANLAEVLERNTDLLKADLMIFADGPVHQSGRPTVFFGSRGIVTVSLTVYGPARPLHSGHYGNWAPNPGEKLAGLLASMKDDQGRVLVEGFYDDVIPLTSSEKAAIAAIPDIESKLMKELLLARPDGGGKSIEELINLPSLNVRGLGSGWIGEEARTIIPTMATAEIDMRLVKDVRPMDQVERIRAHARKQGFHVVEEEPDEATRRRHPNVVRISSGHGVAAARSPMDTPRSRSMALAVRRASTVEAVLMPTLGGTGPLILFEELLGIPTYGVPIVNHDNNQHAPDENLRLGNLWDGITVFASLLRFPTPRDN
jgi:acetylornithine deacetylase/succinyl-diaminopimelate desuccinylase-like protein